MTSTKMASSREKMSGSFYLTSPLRKRSSTNPRQKENSPVKEVGSKIYFNKSKPYLIERFFWTEFRHKKKSTDF